VFDEVIATEKVLFPGNNLQNEFDIRRQLDIFVLSLVFEITQNLIGRFGDDEELLRIT
jgi:hypothetical protein